MLRRRYLWELITHADVPDPLQCLRLCMCVCVCVFMYAAAPQCPHPPKEKPQNRYIWPKTTEGVGSSKHLKQMAISNQASSIFVDTTPFKTTPIWIICNYNTYHKLI